jgi:ribosomal protein S18 acetylase RimI-like enzyme
MAVTVRLLSKDELPLLAACPPGVFDDPIDAGRAAEFLNDPRHHLAVALESGVVVGFASAVHYIHPDKETPELWINEVAVAEEQRGQGIGRRLLEALLAQARRMDCREAWVLTEPDNLLAQRLYAAAGGYENPVKQVMFSFPIETRSTKDSFG